MRSSFASLSKKTLSIIFSATLALGLMPAAAFADSTNPLSIPGGSEGASRVASSAEGGAPEVFSHCPSEGDPSVDAGGAAYSSVDGFYINEEVPLATAGRGYVEIELDDQSDDDAVFADGIEHGEAVFSLDERSAYYAGNKSYHVMFDANGGDWAPDYSDDIVAAYGGEMPNIESYLAHSASGAPKRAKYVFMGFYDGSDWTRPGVTKYYDSNFKAVDGAVYPYAADGFVLYAGWAPVLSYKVPTSVSIAVGSVQELGGPTIEAGRIVNDSPWPIHCSAIRWDAEELTVGEDDLVAAQAKVEGFLAKSVTMTASSLGQMFSNVNGVYLQMTTQDGATSSVTPGNTAAASFTVPPRSTVDVSYTFSLAEGTSVIGREMVSKTTLITPFEVLLQNDDGSDASDPVRSAIMFYAGPQATGGQLDSIPATKGSALPSLSVKTAPLFEGRTFTGWYDAAGKKYYDEYGEPVRDAQGDILLWDKDADTVLTAGWDVKGCPVLFKAGGEGASLSYAKPEPSRLVSVDYDQPLSSAFNLGGSLPTPRWVVNGESYKFQGWYDAEGNRYYGTEIMHDYNGTLVLTARWSGVPVSVTWDAQGGSSVDPWTSFPSGSALSERGELPVTTRAGYTFAGWWTDSLSGTQISSSFEVIDACTFYARWSADPITLSWNIDGTVYNSEPVLYNEKLTVIIPEELAAPSKGEGWQFRFWAHENGSQLAAGTPLPTQNTTYYAKWNARVTFDATDGAFAGGNKTNSGFYACGDKLTAPADPVREGYTFKGWYAGETKLASDTLVEAPITYTAKWGGNDYDMVLNAAGGVFSDGGFTRTVEATAGDPLVLPTDVTRDGYTFDGWFTDSACTNPAPDTAPTKNTSFYAKWKGKELTFTFLGEGGMPATAATTGTYADDAKLPVPADPTRAGYTFKGWFSSLDVPTSGVDENSPMPTSNATYHAKWEGNTITLTWNADENGGVWTGAPQTTQVYGENDNKVEVPQGNPTKLGYAFIGWYSAKDGGVRVTTNTNLPTSDTVFYARFENHPSDITFDLGGGSWNMPSGVSVTADIDKPMPQIKSGITNATKPVRTGYEFDGYYDNTNVKYYNADLTSARDWNLGEDTTLIAHWTPWKRTVEIVDGGFYNDAKVIASGEVTWDKPAQLLSEAPSHSQGDFMGWSFKSDVFRADANIPKDFYKTSDLEDLYALCQSEDVTFPDAGSKLIVYAIYQLPMYPKDSFDDIEDKGGDSFYLELEKKDLPKPNIPEDAWGFYGLDDIATAADDIAENKEQSKYYPFYKALLDNDLQFTTGWKYYEYDNAATPIARDTATATDADGNDKLIPYKVRIIGLCHDDLTSAKNVNGNTVDKAGITFQFVDLLYNSYQMNQAVGTANWDSSRYRYLYQYMFMDLNRSNDTNEGGWGKSELRANMNPGIDTDLNPNNTDANAVWDLAPEMLQGTLVPVSKKYYADISSIQAAIAPSSSTDYLFIPSYSELVASAYQSGYTNLVNEGGVYQFYKDKGVLGNATADTAYNANRWLMKSHILEDGSVDVSNRGLYGTSNATTWYWWERSISVKRANEVMAVSFNGGPFESYFPTDYFGVSPAFCMGSGIQVGDEVTITYDAGEGYFDGNTSLHKKKVASVYGSALTTISDIPQRPGYTFDGWGSLPAQTPRGNATYRAKWTPYAYNLVFNAGEGTGSVPVGAKVTYNTAGYTVSEADFPHKIGSCFDGWSFDASPSMTVPRGDAITPELLVQVNGGTLPSNGSTFYLTAYYHNVVAVPHDTLPEDETGFYLHIDSAAANSAGLPADAIGYYYTDDIKTAANHIADVGNNESDDAYAFFNRLMTNDVQFTTNWYYYEYIDSKTGRVLSDDEDTLTARIVPARASEPAKDGDGAYKTITYKVRIIGLNHDDKSDGSGKAGITFQLVNLLYNTYAMKDATASLVGTSNERRMYYPYCFTVFAPGKNTTLGGWGNSSLRTNMYNEDGTVFGLAPDVLRSAIVTVDKKYYTGQANDKAAGIGSLATSDSKMFVPSYSELVLAGSAAAGWNGLLSASEGEQYAFYKNKGVRGDKAALKAPGDATAGSSDIVYADNLTLVKFHVLPAPTVKSEIVNGEIIDTKTLHPYYNANLINGSTGSDNSGWGSCRSWSWFGRSPSPVSAGSFLSVYHQGNPSLDRYSSNTHGVSPCFCF